MSDRISAVFAILVAQILTWWEMALEEHSHIFVAVYITFLMELHPAFPICTLFFMNKGHGIGITKNIVAVEGTQLSPLGYKTNHMTGQQRTLAFGRAEIRDGREAQDQWSSLQTSTLWQVSCFPTCAGLLHTACALILHNLVLKVAQLLAAGLL